MKTSSCWMGGLWSDALGEKEFERGPGIEKRCKDLLAYISESSESYNALRAIEPKIVSELAERVKKDAGKDESASELAALLGLVADAERETIHARRAADKVKEDIDKKDNTQYSPDKVAATPELRKTDALHALLNAKVAGYDADARALGMLVVIDRMQVSHGLPKHLKIFTVGEPLRDVFGVAPPAVSDDGSMKAAPGLWFDYLQTIAKQNGRAVPEMKSMEDKETLAWNGVLDALGEKLVNASDVPQDRSLGVVTHGVAARLHQQLEMERSLVSQRKK
jgi:hypothetical protein